MSLVRRSACLVIPVEIEHPPAWTRGPLPVSSLWPSSAPQARLANIDARLRYFESRVCQLLYGTESHPVRWHRVCEMPIGNASIIAVELLLTSSNFTNAQGLAVLHLQLGPNPVVDLASLSDLTSSGTETSNRHRFQSALSEGVRISTRTRRAFTVGYVTFSDMPPSIMSSMYDAWPPKDQWLWSVASATPLSEFPPDVEDESLFSGRIRLSADWQSLVLRNGISFVGTRPDSGRTDSFHAAAQIYVHSIYLDVLLIGRIQADALNELANRIANIDMSNFGAKQLVSLEGRLIELRQSFGQNHITAHDKGREMLERYLAQHGTSDLRSRLVEDLADSSRYVEAQLARSTNAILGLVAVLGLPFGLAYAAGALWGSSGAKGFLAWTAAAVVASFVMTKLSPVRSMLHAIGKNLES